MAQKRKKLSEKYSKKLFTATAARTRVENIPKKNPQRGGIRM